MVNMKIANNIVVFLGRSIIADNFKVYTTARDTDFIKIDVICNRHTDFFEVATALQKPLFNYIDRELWSFMHTELCFHHIVFSFIYDNVRYEIEVS
jgi:hypothetical protein